MYFFYCFSKLVNISLGHKLHESGVFVNSIEILKGDTVYIKALERFSDRFHICRSMVGFSNKPQSYVQSWGHIMRLS